MIEIMLDVELKIEDAKRRIFERFQIIIVSNCENNFAGERLIYDQAFLNLQAENFGATPNEQEEEEDHSIDDVVANKKTRSKNSISSLSLGYNRTTTKNETWPILIWPGRFFRLNESLVH